LFTGIKNIKLTDNASHTLSAGEYFLAHAYSMRSSNANILASFGTGMYVTGSQTTGGVYFGSVTTNTAPPYRWMGIVSTTSNGTTTGYNIMPQTIHTSAITGTGGSSQWRWLAPHLYT
jgi:L-lactate permease